jgi:hypothetical protein
LAKLEARSEKKRQEAIDFTTSSYEKEEEACVRRLALAADVRARGGGVSEGGAEKNRVA